MKGTLPDQSQRELFRPLLRDLIDPNHELALLANRIDWGYGETGFEKIFEYSVQVNGKETAEAGAKWHLSDTTVQENDTTFPTDAKLCKKVIDKCNRIAG